MTTTKPSNFKYRILGAIVLMAFLVGDAAVVAIPAMALSPAHLVAVVVAFVMIAGGALFTVWQLKS
jgi:hypothetical protein